jgi:PAS domain S-box-containing protein
MDTELRRTPSGLTYLQRIAHTIFALETTGVGIWEHNCETMQVYIDAGWLARLGLPTLPSPANASDVEAMIHPDDLPIQQAAYARHLADPSTPYSSLFRLRATDGSYRWINSHGKAFEFSSDGKPRRMVGTHTDVTAQQEQLQRAQHFEGSWKQLMSILPVGVYLMDTKGHCTYLNAAWEKLAGISAEEALGFGWEKALAPQDRATLLQRWEETFASNRIASEPVEAEFRFYRAEGEQPWIRSYSVPIHSPAGDVTGYVGTLTDVSSLHASLASLRNFVELLPSGVVLVENDRVVLNRECERIIGYLRAEITTVDDWLEKVLHVTEAHARHEFRNEMNSLKHEPLTLQAFHKDGQRCYLELRTNQGSGFQVWQIHDVTEQRQAEQRFRVIFEQSTAPHFLYCDHAIVACNEATLKSLGANNWSQIVGHDPWGFSPTLQLDGTPSRESAIAMEAAAGSRSAHKFEWTQRRLDGTLFPVEVTLSQVTIQSRVHYLVSWHDLSEQKERQAQVAQSFKMASLGEMAAGVAHEVNNPLAIIKSKAELLLTASTRGETFSAADVARHTRVIDDTVERISKIVRGLKNFAHDSEQETTAETDLRKVVEETLALCAERFRNSGVGLRAKIPEFPVLANVRPFQISQVLLNLLNNAFDAADGSAKPMVRVELRSDRSGPSIHCIDSGAGVPPNIRSRIMEPFFTTKEVGQGTGLGLSISRGLVESNGGRLYLDASRGETCFVIQFGARKVKPTENRKPKSNPKPKPKTKRR